MEFWIRIIELLRRKRVVIPVFLVALTLGALAYFGTPTIYVSSSTMVLTTTEYGGTEFQDPANPVELTNPMLNFNDSLRTTSAILIQTMNTKDVAKQLGVREPTQLFVNDGRTNPELLGLNGPFLYIVGKSQNPDEAERVVVEAEKLMKQKLREWQSALNAPDKTFVSIADVVPPGTAVPDRARATKLAVMAFGLGFVLALGIAYFASQRLARRRARKAAAPAAVAVVPPADDTDDDTAGQHEDDEDDGDSSAPAAVASGAWHEQTEPASVVTSLRPGPMSGHGPRPVTTKPGPAIVRAPVKTRVRSRNR